MWRLILLPVAQEELNELPIREQSGMVSAFAKLSALGDSLGAPHTSNIEGVASYLRELRPRGGASPWRALYRRIGNELVVGAIGPEAINNRRGFDRAVKAAVERLDRYARRVEERHD